MILIVDDKPENLFSLQQVLQGNRFDTDTAQSGEEALRKALKNDYALIILDVQMPGMDGFEVAEAITGLNKTRDIPIIFLSAVNTHKRFVTKGFESGAVDYLTKPVDPDILILKVRNLVQLYEKTHALKEAERELKARVSELQSTLESLPGIAFAANAGGGLERTNQHWLEYAEGPDTFPETVPGSPPLEAVWQEAVRQGGRIEEEVCLRRLADGTYRYHLLRAMPVFVQERLVRWVGTLTDIHEQKQLNELLERRVAERTRELLETNRELEIINHDLQQFASVASHDLREPLRKIQLFGNMIYDAGVLQGKWAGHLEKMIRSSARMSTLIQDLLSVTRLSENERFEAVDLTVLVRDVLSDLELVIREKGAAFHLDPLPVLEVVPAQFRQVFQNIIGNALKFSQPGTPPVVSIASAFTATPDPDADPATDGPFCRITITDNGIGFDEKYVGKIFTLFQRLHAREEYEGTGIGLAIVKKIVEKHNGFIFARSRPGEGARFILLLPVRQPALRHPVKDTAPSTLNGTLS
ncbi:sensor histidine kinase [Flaviaesturariibacter amylovorans]|uniref:histidine kinase n=1 Tax=Flaviaesturariibacter amylovorans TaxID=1084520 RepID=A0ABP8HN11_9BACT